MNTLKLLAENEEYINKSFPVLYHQKEANTMPDAGKIHSQKAFDELKGLLDSHGKFTGTGHKRILIPKRVLNEQDLTDNLGFKKVLIGIPEAGQKRFSSFRHLDHNYHIHDHDTHWSMHNDDHASITMKLEKLKKMREEAKRNPQNSTGEGGTKEKIPSNLSAYMEGSTHLLGEGLPGAYYYLKGRFARSPGMKNRLQQSLGDDYYSRISKMKTSPSHFQKTARSIETPYRALQKDLDAGYFSPESLPGYLKDPNISKEDRAAGLLGHAISTQATPIKKRSAAAHVASQMFGGAGSGGTIGGITGTTTGLAHLGARALYNKATGNTLPDQISAADVMKRHVGAGAGIGTIGGMLEGAYSGTRNVSRGDLSQEHYSGELAKKKVHSKILANKKYRNALVDYIQDNSIPLRNQIEEAGSEH